MEGVGTDFMSRSSASAPRKHPGAVTTPPGLARELCAGWADARDPLLDPACGRGDLLLAAWERSGRDAAYARTHLHGLEVVPQLVAEARGRLRRAIGGSAGEAAARHVRLADALAPETRWPDAAVIANPPWVSFSGRQAAPPRAGRARPGWPSLHGAFLERIAAHVAATGRPARVLLPASVADLERYGPLRARVTELARLAAPPRELGESAFDDVVEPAVWIELAPRGGEASGAAPWTPLDPTAVSFLDRLGTFPRLPRESFGDPGVHTGNAAADLVVRDGAANAPGLREGKDLRAYTLAAPRLGLRVDHAPRAGQRFRIAPLERYRAVPVLLRQTADRPIAALHTAPGYFRNTLLACRPPTELDPAFCVAVLNAPTAHAWHRKSFRDSRQRTFPQVKVGHLRTQPFPIAARASAPRLHDEVARRVRALGHDPAPEEVDRIERLVLEAFGFERADVPD